MKGICKLCLNENELQQSHIIPRSYFKRLKQQGKLVMVRDGKHSIEGNIDPKEAMLCWDCEQYLSTNLEQYGIDVLRNRSKVIKNNDHIIFSSFNYNKYYLFLLSILWRASVAEHVYYASVEGDENLNDALRHCIHRNSLRFNQLSRVSIDHFIKICLFRIVDKTGFFKDETIRAVLSNVKQTFVESIDGITWYFIADGFLIMYVLVPGKDYYDMKTRRFRSQLGKGSHQKIMKVEITESPLLTQVFGSLITAVGHAKS
ncbi:hypothetical protein WKH09_15965 [Pantoea agglomerans]|uniref:hypothetical protein n=1 Tax=Enterobacter agglomerans TaxID=549 RepID=UPI003C7CE62E